MHAIVERLFSQGAAAALLSYSENLFIKFVTNCKSVKIWQVKFPSPVFKTQWPFCVLYDLFVSVGNSKHDQQHPVLWI